MTLRTSASKVVHIGGHSEGEVFRLIGGLGKRAKMGKRKILRSKTSKIFFSETTIPRGRTYLNRLDI